jgi:hypothetical protein
MTPVQDAVAAQVDSQKYVEVPVGGNKKNRSENFSFLLLADATETILYHAFWLADQKNKLPRSEYKKLLFDQGWKGEEEKYLKIAIAFSRFSPQDLAKVEPRTVYQLAENSKKYKFVIDALLSLKTITQDGVRSLIRKQHPAKQQKLEKPSIWRRTKNGGRYCQIPPIHETDEQTGTTLQRMIDEEGLSVQHIVAEAIAIRQAYKEGLLVRAEQADELG